MKVPKMYKSSDRYNAGTDVIYDDDSKLQYAPFVYATAESGDNGDDSGGGDDEEGDDVMVVNYDDEARDINKSFKELKDAVKSGKLVIIDYSDIDDETGYYDSRYYLVSLDNQNAGEYIATFACVYSDDGENELLVMQFLATNETDNMAREQAG